MSASQPAAPSLNGELNDVREMEAYLQRTLQQRERRSRRMAVLAPAALILLVGVAWEFGVELLELPPYLLPKPSAIAQVMVGNLSLYIEHGLRTFQEVGLGYLMAVVVAIPLAIAIAEWKTIERAIYPILVSSHSVPKSAIAPLFIVWFGFGIMPKILIVFLISFFPIIISSVVGFKSVEQEKRFLALAIGLTKRDIFLKIQLPHALPSIFGGLKVGITLAVVGAVVAEFVGADAGLGYLLIVAGSSLDTTRVFASLICLMVLSTTLFLFVGIAERWAIPWHISQRKDLPPAVTLDTP